MNVLVLVDDLGQKNGRQCYELPMVRLMAHLKGEIQACIENPKQVPDPSLLPLLGRASTLGVEAFELAVVIRSECRPGDLRRRAKVLDLCLLWFTAQLRLALPGVPMDLFIPHDARFES